MAVHSAEHQDLAIWEPEGIRPSKRSLGRAMVDPAEVLFTRPNDTPSEWFFLVWLGV